MQFRTNSWPPYGLEWARNQPPALVAGQDLLEKQKHILPYSLLAIWIPSLAQSNHRKYKHSPPLSREMKT